MLLVDAFRQDRLFLTELGLALAEANTDARPEPE